MAVLDLLLQRPEKKVKAKDSLKAPESRTEELDNRIMSAL